MPVYSTLKDIDVFILCGGLGKRLGAITKKTPKPMIKIGKNPFLDLIINYLTGFGFRRFILGIGYKAEAIRDYYSKKQFSGINILFSQEKKPLGTGGAVKHGRRLIKSNPFLVLNGDSFCKFDPLRLLKFHRAKKSLITILLKKMPQSKDYGRIKIDKSWRIIKFNEKIASARACFINAGIYVFDKKIFKELPCVSKFSFEFDYFPRMTGINIFGCLHKGFFIDIGTPRRYLKAKKYLAK